MNICLPIRLFSLISYIKINTFFYMENKYTIKMLSVAISQLANMVPLLYPHPQSYIPHDMDRFVLHSRSHNNVTCQQLINSTKSQNTTKREYQVYHNNNINIDFFTKLLKQPLNIKKIDQLHHPFYHTTTNHKTLML